VTLDVDVVARGTVGLATEEVVEPHLVQRRRGRVGGQVPADARRRLVGTNHHGHRVPANERPDAALHFEVTGKPRLPIGWNRVHIRGPHRRRDTKLPIVGGLAQPGQQVPRSGLTPVLHDGIQRVEPLLGLARVDIGQLVRERIVEHRNSLVWSSSSSPDYGHARPLRVPAGLQTPRYSTSREVRESHPVNMATARGS